MTVENWVRSVASLALALMLVSHPDLAAAGPWTRSPGHGYAKGSVSVFRGSGFRDANGRFDDRASYLSISPAVYAEVGVLPSLHLEGYLPYVWAQSDFGGGGGPTAIFCRDGSRISDASQSTFGDALLGVQLDPALLSIPHALKLQTKLPLYDPTGPGGPCGPFFPQPGDGQLDVTLLASVGDSFVGGRFFAFLELGHRHRTEVFVWGDSGQAFGETFIAAGQAGYRYLEGGFILFGVRLAAPYTTDTTTRGELVLAPAFTYPILGVSLELELAFIPWARNSAAGAASELFFSQASLGVSTSF